MVQKNALERSVVVPVFNGMRFLPEFWARLISNLPAATELIIIDDGSVEPIDDVSPNSTEHVEVVKLRSPLNLGYAKTVNRGVAAARADRLHIVNTDVFLRENIFDITERQLARDARLGIIGAKLFYPTNNRVQHIGVAFAERRKHHFFRHCPGGLVPKLDLKNLQAATFAFVTIPTRVWRELGGLSEDFYNRNEDIDFCLRAVEAGYRIAVAEDAVAYHWESVSGPARFALDAENEAEFWGRWKSRVKVDIQQYLAPALDFAFHRDGAAFAPNSNATLANFTRGDLIPGLEDALEQRVPAFKERIERRRRFTANPKIHLPMELKYGAAHLRSSYVYVVDEWTALDENALWFEQRRKIGVDDLIIDLNANVLWSSEVAA